MWDRAEVWWRSATVPQALPHGIGHQPGDLLPQALNVAFDVVEAAIDLLKASIHAVKPRGLPV